MGLTASKEAEAKKDVDLLAKLLKESSPLQWSPKQVEDWLGLNGLKSEEISRAVEDCLIDGEFICEAPTEVLSATLLNFLKSEDLTNHIVALAEEQIRSNDMVLAFQGVDKMDFDVTGHEPSVLGEEITLDNAASLIKEYHSYTRNTTNGGAPTVKRMWANQPKISRRYYGAPVCKLTKRPQEASIDLLLYYSLAVSAYQTTDQRLMWPRSCSSKRVNPSSGGLHPVEAYVIRSLDTITVIEHYLPMYHSLEQRYQTNTINIPNNDFIIALTVAMWREIWKYGPRGWRYTQLDVGHAIGSIVMACKIGGYQTKVIDANLISNSSRILGLQQILDKQLGSRESEQPVVFLLLTPDNENASAVDERFTDLLEALRKLSDVSSELYGEPNIMFSRAKNPVIWPYIDAIECATKITCKEIPVIANGSVIPHEFDLFSDLSSLRKSVRVRRSVLNFKDKNISVEQLINCLSSVLPESNSLVREHCQNFSNGFDIKRCAPHIHFALWVTGVTGMKNGLYILLRGEGSEIFSAFNNLAEENSRTLIQIKNVPKFMNLFYVSCSSEREQAIVKKEASEMSCHQKIAYDCSVVISILAPLEQSLAVQPRNYNYLHWEAGFLGQMLYVQAYELGMGATGMGCFLDDESAAVFGVIPLLQPIYHFALGRMETDPRFSSME